MRVNVVFLHLCCGVAVYVYMCVYDICFCVYSHACGETLQSVCLLIYRSDIIMNGGT